LMSFQVGIFQTWISNTTIYLVLMFPYSWTTQWVVLWN
jgi:hypothetical protein